MKAILSPVLSIAILLTACTADPKQDPMIKQLEQDEARARAQVAERDSTINAMFSTFNRINENLREIQVKQGELGSTGTGAEQSSNVEDRIMGGIQSIDDLLADNQKLITKLRAQSKVSANGISELERTIAEMERSTNEKNVEIEGLKEELASSNSSLATLIAMYRDKTQLSDMQRNDLNTAYYVIGTSKELRANGVLTKEGGFAGIGANTKLNMENLAKENFKQIDILEMQEIPVLSEKFKLSTSHPAGSFKIEEGSGKLMITDANAFWSVSKYLVIVVE
ncbi:MAG: hypothetical protein IPF95_17295 [Flavobacteriales bacterium]|nr:hypothetical protein [Flavobacteriales bacterium]MBK7297552.1 hypothetical protein [Flavobacteriales bacterium]HQZ42551.1 hypothetical protein [Flavobacteriales bacterium]